MLPAMTNILSENKIPLKTIMDRVGYSDSDVTNSIYHPRHKEHER